MKILIDIGHPAHVHYFRNFMKLMTFNGHQFHIISRDKEVSFNLLRKYDISFSSRGHGGKGFLGKLLYIIKADIILIRAGLTFRPDILLSFASPYAAHASFILRKPHITFDDTEHAKYETLLYRPFTKVILNPQCFKKNLGQKQIRFNGFMELCYLHPAYFKPDKNILLLLGLKENESFVVFRFVSWTAHHDINAKGFSSADKISIVKALSAFTKVFISSEGILPVELEQYKLTVLPEKLHDVLYFSSLYIGEGATTASECAMLGTPAIYVNSLSAGTLEEQERLNLLFSFRSPAGVLEKAMELLEMPDLKAEFQNRRKAMLMQKINMTDFLVWFIENYPQSFDVMKKNPEYQEKFK